MHVMETQKNIEKNTGCTLAVYDRLNTHNVDCPGNDPALDTRANAVGPREEKET